MSALQSVSPLLRIGVFYDGTYFSHVSNYYLYEHSRKARISITGLHEFIREEIAKLEGLDKRYCQIVDAHYFRGRLSAKLAQAQDSLYRDRVFDEVLIREGVTMHLLPVAADRDGDVKEKGIDVWFALEAYELAVHKRFDLSVLVTGDGDFVPLVRKLNTLGTRVMLLAWDFEFMRKNVKLGTRVSQALINEATYAVMMSDEIESRSRKKDVTISQLFVQKLKDVSEASVAKRVAVVCGRPKRIYGRRESSADLVGILSPKEIMMKFELNGQEQHGFRALLEQCRHWSEEHKAEVGVAEMALGAAAIAWGVHSGAIVVGAGVVGTQLSKWGIAGGATGFGIGAIGSTILGSIGVAGAYTFGIPALVLGLGGTAILGAAGYGIGDAAQSLLTPAPGWSDLLAGGSLLYVGVALMIDGARRVATDERVLRAASTFVSGIIELAK